MKNLITRTLSGIVFLVVLIGSILWNQYAFTGLFLIIAMLGLNEYFSMVNRFEAVHIDKVFGLVCGTLMFLLFGSVATGLAEPKVLLIGVFLLIAPFAYELIRKESSPFPNSAYFILGLIYVVIPFSMLTFLGNHDMVSGIYRSSVVLGYFILVWSYDVFAYVVGSLIGRHKLFVQISPGKTWEGTIGSAVITIGVAWLNTRLFEVFSFEQWAVIALIIIIFGTLGDLTESMIKRSVNIKDSGTIIPGHGGVLDRFDGVLFSAPMVLIYLLLFT